MDELPPPGWFEDPVDPSVLRYWDGKEWTDQRTPKSTFPPPPPRLGFTDIGSWMTATFKVLATCRVAMVGYFVASLIASYAFGLSLLAIWGDARYEFGEWTGVSTDRFVITIGIGLVMAVVTLWLYLFATHQLYFGHVGSAPTTPESLSAAVAAMPRMIGWGLVLVAGAAVVMIVMGAAFAIAPVLGVLVFLAGIAGFVWLAVKLAFFVVACVAPIRDRNPIESSFDVSAGRFWPAFGRVALIWALGLAISFVVSTVVLPFTGGPDVEMLEAAVVTTNDEVVFIDVGQLLKATLLIGPGAVVSSLSTVAATLVGLAATAGLYAQIHPPSRKDT